MELPGAEEHDNDPAMPQAEEAQQPQEDSRTDKTDSHLVDQEPLPAAVERPDGCQKETQLPNVKSEPDLTTPACEGRVPESSSERSMERSLSGRGRGRARNRGRGRGGKGRGERDSTAEATPEEEGKVRLTRRTSNRERAKPKHYSPTQQDKETRRKRQKLQDEGEEGGEADSQAESDDDKPLNVAPLKASTEPLTESKKNDIPDAGASEMDGAAMPEATPAGPDNTGGPGAESSDPMVVEPTREAPGDHPQAEADDAAQQPTAEAAKEADAEEALAAGKDEAAAAEAGSKLARATRRRKSIVIEESDDDADDIPDVGAVEERDDWQPEAHPEDAARRSASVESEPAVEEDAKSSRKRIRKSAGGGSSQGKEPPKKRPTTKAGRAAAAKKNAGSKTIEVPSDDIPKPKAGSETDAQPSVDVPVAVTDTAKVAAATQPATKAKAQGIGERAGASKSLKAAAPKAVPIVPAKEGIAGDVSQADQRLAGKLKELNRIYDQTQQQVQDLVKQMQSEIDFLDRTEMTVNLLQETGVGKTIRAISKLKTLAPISALEQRAATVLSRWRKLSEVEAAPAVAPKAAGSAAEPKASQPGRAAAADAKPTADAKTSTEVSAKPPGFSARASTDAKAAADVGTAGDRPGQRAAGNQAASAQPATAHRDVLLANGQAPQAGHTGIAVRDKAILILETSFAPPPSVSPREAAVCLESALFQSYSSATGGGGGVGNPGPKYLRRLHVLWSWLAPESSAHRPHLLAKVRAGVVSPAELAMMSVGEVDKLSQADVLVTQETIGADNTAHHEAGQPDGLEALPAMVATEQEPQPMEA